MPSNYWDTTMMYRSPLIAFLVAASAQVAASPGSHWIQVQGGTWAVPPTDVAQMASLLPAAALKAKRGKKTEKEVSTYTVQFKGLGAPGRRVVELRGSCEVDGTSRAELQKNFLNVLDGGECYFDEVWDPTQRRFKFLRFNGVA